MLVTVRADITYAGDPGGTGADGLPRPASSIAAGDLDPDWIGRAAAHRWVVITKDRHMLTRPAERQAILDEGARHIRLQGPSRRAKLTKWDQLRIIVAQWDGIEALAETPGPWVYVATRTGLRKEL